MHQRLDVADAVLVADVVQETYRVDSVSEFPAVALQQARRLVRSDLASFNDVNPLAQTVTAFFDPPGWPMFDGAFEVFGRLQVEHPSIRHVSETGDGSARMISDFLTGDEFHALALYVEFFAKVGIEHQISITLPAALPRIIGVALNRSAEGGDFDERDRTMLNLIRPHLVQAYEQTAMRERLTKHAATLAQVFADRNEHVVLLDDPVFDASGAGLALLTRHFGPPTSGGVLPESVASWVDRQRRVRSHPFERDAPNPPNALTRADGNHRLVLRFVPGRDGPDAIVAAERSSVVATDLERLGLSPREAEIVHLLVLGATNAQIGEQLHIASGTVKKHLDNIYRKLGVTSRWQAASLALELLP
jgi:DNA-binding CsgD family transcriptional regulator